MVNFIYKYFQKKHCTLNKHSIKIYKRIKQRINARTIKFNKMVELVHARGEEKKKKHFLIKTNLKFLVLFQPKRMFF